MNPHITNVVRRFRYMVLAMLLLGICALLTACGPGSRSGVLAPGPMPGPSAPRPSQSAAQLAGQTSQAGQASQGGRTSRAGQTSQM